MAAAVALAIPAATLASGGSAGDQQYSDPFAGTAPASTHSSTATHAASGTTTNRAASATSTQAASPSTTSTAAPSSPASPTSQPSSSVGGGPSQVSSAAPASTGGHGDLPYTGYDGWAAALAGFTLVAGGVALRLLWRWPRGRRTP